MIAQKTSELSNNLDDGKNIRLSFFYHNKKTIGFLSSLVLKILSRNNLVYLHSTLMTILREIIVNAVKANTKRIYFNKINMNIENPDEYSSGMENFKAFIVDNQDSCEAELKERNFKVLINIDKGVEGFKFKIINNSSILPEELKRIEHRYSMAKNINDFSEAYGEIADDIEGEGLGIILTLLFLRNSGIGEDSLRIISSDNSTESSLFIPFEPKPQSITNIIQAKILEEIKELPTLPETVLKLQEMCQIPNIDFSKIAQKITLDPSLSASVLKLSNSAGFVTRNRIENILDAIKVIGLRNLKAILIASSARKIINQKYSTFKKIWEHCNKTAFYARAIALKYGYSKIAECVFLSGLLHDLGKIVLLSTNSSLAEWISEITKNRELRTSTVIEEVSIGISHSSIGGLIAAKWNLPDYLIDTIKYHHSPLFIDNGNREIVFITYLANQICSIEEKRFNYFFIEDEILSMFNIKSEKEFNELHDELKSKYSEAELLSD
jgi:HD-like signal output (HDOD) protein